MKTTPKSETRPGSHLPQIMRGLLGALAAGTLASCGSQSIGAIKTTRPAAIPVQQFQVGEHEVIEYHAPVDSPKWESTDEVGAAWARSFESSSDLEWAGSQESGFVHPIAF